MTSLLEGFSQLNSRGSGNIKTARMKRINNICFILMLMLFYSQITLSQNVPEHVELYLFASREFCTSGDTVWFKVQHNNDGYDDNNIVHVQLSGSDSRVITTVAGKSEGEWAEGYIHVPDSLSSGVYFLSAFYNYQRGEGGWNFLSRSLFVYNRFSEALTSFSVPVNLQESVAGNFDFPDLIQKEKTVYTTREQVRVGLNLKDLSNSGVKQVVVKAERIDDMATKTGGHFLRTSATNKFPHHNYKENNGILIGGNVINNANGSAGKDVVVLLSLLNDSRYLDYCLTDGDGYFSFFLREAIGTGEIVLQAVSENNDDWEISLLPAGIDFSKPVPLENKILSVIQSDFIKETVDASYYSRIFGESYEVWLPEFSISRKFEIPIYGKPHKRIVLADYYDLPDFQEISRELLHGVQFRRRGNELNIRLLNLNADEYFKSEPLRLINGIPVFRNRMFAYMGSDEIKYIDYVLDERLFGDLRFNGVLAVYLHDDSNGWMSQQSNLFRFTVPMLQPERTPPVHYEKTIPGNIPDFRQVFYWQLHNTGESRSIEFRLSDFKGKVKISVEGVSPEGTIFNTSEIIEIK